MRQKRAKSYKKQMLVYQHTFKFRDPYQVLLDDQVIAESYESNFNLIKAICKTLQVEDIKPMITQCCMQKLYESNNQQMITMAKEMFERRRCNHNIKEPELPINCISSVVDVNGFNKHRYVVVTQDINLRRRLRKIPGVPLIHINRSVMVMEPLSDASKNISEYKEKRKLTSGLNDPKFAGLVKPEEEVDMAQIAMRNGRTGATGNPQKKRKMVKGVNPLSMKKKQKKVPVHIHDSKKSGSSASGNGAETAKDQQTDSNSANNNDETAIKRKRKRTHSKKPAASEEGNDAKVEETS